jgi:hypothetical protein
MAKKCYRVDYVNCANVAGVTFACSESVEVRPGGSCGGPYVYSADLGFNYGNASEKSATVTIVDCSFCAGCNCGVSNNEPCDCLNGGCITAATYNTPGKYANLAACQSGCAKDSPCAGECVSAADLANLQQAAGLVQTRICGS